MTAQSRRLMIVVLALSVCGGSGTEQIIERCFHGVGCWQFVRYGDYVDVSFESIAETPISTAAMASSSSRTHPFRIVSDMAGPHYAGQFPFPTQSVITWTFVLFAGTEAASHDDEFVYGLPYAEGVESTVTQAYDGRTTHQAEHRHSLDFALAVGTPVHAARAGDVALVIDGPCASESGTACANVRVDLRHSDGTYASYQHLKPGSVRVGPGESVAGGEQLALSGNSGRSSRPHLHFQVYTPTPEGEHIVESLPTLFRTAGGNVHLVRSGSYVNPPRTPDR